MELEKLPGVGHKTASVVMSQGFKHPAFPVDTHIHRLSQRWGLTSGKNVVQTEKHLKCKVVTISNHFVTIMTLNIFRKLFVVADMELCICRCLLYLFQNQWCKVFCIILSICLNCNPHQMQSDISI